MMIVVMASVNRFGGMRPQARKDVALPMTFCSPVMVFGSISSHLNTSLISFIAVSSSFVGSIFNLEEASC